MVNCRQGPFLSDHCCIELEVAIPEPALKRQTITSCNIKDVVTEDVVKELDLGTIEGEDINDLVNQLEDKCKRALDTLAPEETKCVTIRQKKCWLTKEVLDQKRVVRRREKIWQKYKTEGTWRALVEHRNKYNAMIREEKLKSTSGKVEECKGDTKKLYSLVRYLTGTKVQNPMPNNTGDKKLANDFADYFIEKIQKIWDDLDGNPKFKPKRNSTITPLKIFEPTTADEVTTIIKGMKTKSCELDFLPTSLLKKALPYVINTITNIMNVSLEQGVFPDSWKTAIIRPLLKKHGLELITSNYRPVSNLPFLSKVLEKIVLARYNDHCDRYNLIPSFQSAYRPKHSCETSMVKLVNDLLWSMERKEATAVAVIDLSAAFDTVDHNILINLLHETFGIGDKALRWFQSYLENRYCKVKIGKDYSEKKLLNFSVPQGSCVGPVLYLSYAASISDVVSDVSEEGDPRPISIIGFADDHAMKKSFIPTLEDDEEVCIANIQACLFRVKEWMDSMRLKMNEGKTEFIIIGSSHQIAKCSTTHLNVNNIEVQRSSVIKYLGTHMDEKLSFKEHITAKCRTAAINFQRIKAIWQVLTEQATRNTSIGHSHVPFGLL